MNAVIRSMPALGNPNLHWSLSIGRIPKGTDARPSYRLEIMGARFSPGFIKTAAHAGKILARLADDLDGLPVANPARHFEIADESWYAADPETLVRLWVALNAPHLLQAEPTDKVPFHLPPIREVLDHSRLMAALQTPYGKETS